MREKVWTTEKKKKNKNKKVSVYETIEGDKWISKQCTKFTSQDYKSCDQDFFRYSVWVSSVKKQNFVMSTHFMLNVIFKA